MRACIRLAGYRTKCIQVKPSNPYSFVAPDYADRLWAVSSLSSCSFPALTDLGLDFVIYAVDGFVDAGWLEPRLDEHLAVLCSKVEKFMLTFTLKPLDGGATLMEYPVILETIANFIRNSIPKTSSCAGFDLDLVIM